MALLSPTGTALREAFGRFAGIHAASLSMPVCPLGYRPGLTGRPSGRYSRRAAPYAALEQFHIEVALAFPFFLFFPLIARQQYAGAFGLPLALGAVALHVADLTAAPEGEMGHHRVAAAEQG